MRLLLLSTATAVVALAATGCSSSGGAPVPTPPASQPAAGSTAPTAASTASGISASAGPGQPTGTAPSVVPSVAKLSAALLTATDIKGFKTGKKDDSSSPLPCTPDAPPLETQVPPQGKADSSLVSDSGQSLFTEGIYSFTDAAKAESFVAAGTRGFACSSGKVGSFTAKIVGPYDPKVTAHTDQNLAWDAAVSDGSFATLSLSRVGTTVIGLVFQATKAGQHEIVPPKVIELALEKLAANS